MINAGTYPRAGRFVAVAVGTTTVNTSDDGITWTARTGASSRNWGSVCWSRSLKLFCAVAYSGTGNRVMTSPDGITWTGRNPAAQNAWVCVVWSEEHQLFVACCSTSTVVNQKIMTSPDGTTWTIRSVPTNENYYSVTYSPQLGRFVACGDIQTNDIIYSDDAINWIGTTVPRNIVLAEVTWSDNLGLFVASSLGVVSSTGLGYMYTSPDGITWTERSTPSPNQDWFGVCWSGVQDKFVAGSDENNAEQIAYSSDGTTWVTATAPTTRLGSRCVAYSPYLGLYVIIGIGNAFTSSGRCATSPNGITWTNRTTSAINFEFVCWGEIDSLN
jgi:hypothetical protein